VILRRRSWRGEGEERRERKKERVVDALLIQDGGMKTNEASGLH